MEDKLLDLSKIITYQLSKRVKLNKDEMEIIAYQLRIIISEPQYKKIILVTLSMVHIEFMVKYMRERRQRCLNGCANIS